MISRSEKASVRQHARTHPQTNGQHEILCLTLNDLDQMVSQWVELTYKSAPAGRLPQPDRALRHQSCAVDSTSNQCQLGTYSRLDGTR